MHSPSTGMRALFCCQWPFQFAGLLSAMYFKGEKEVPNPDLSAGLYIRDRNGAAIKAGIPADHIAYQMGEAMQVSSSHSRHQLRSVCDVRWIWHVELCNAYNREFYSKSKAQISHTFTPTWSSPIDAADSLRRPFTGHSPLCADCPRTWCSWHCKRHNGDLHATKVSCHPEQKGLICTLKFVRREFPEPRWTLPMCCSENCKVICGPLSWNSPAMEIPLAKVMVHSLQLWQTDGFSSWSRPQGSRHWAMAGEYHVWGVFRADSQKIL